MPRYLVSEWYEADSSITGATLCPRSAVPNQNVKSMLPVVLPTHFGPYQHRLPVPRIHVEKPLCAGSKRGLYA